MEGNPYNFKAECLSGLEQIEGTTERCTEFIAETAEGRRVVRKNPEEKFGLRKESLDLVELVYIVKGHLLDALSASVTDVRDSFARLSIDDSGRLHTEREDLVDFGFGRAVKASSQCSQKAEHLSVRVAFYRYKASVRGPECVE